MKFGCIAILILVLAIILALLVPLLPVNAKSDKPPIPHHNKPGKSVPANCHSRHAREAGVPCGEDDADDGTSKKKPEKPAVVSVPNSSNKPLPTVMTVPQKGHHVYIPIVVRGKSAGAGLPYPYPAP